MLQMVVGSPLSPVLQCLTPLTPLTDECWTRAGTQQKESNRNVISGFVLGPFSKLEIHNCLFKVFLPPLTQHFLVLSVVRQC